VLKGGELNCRLALRNGKLDELEAKKYMYQMLSAVNYLHSKKIAHRDLKPENFMFKELDGQELKLIDFGLSTNCNRNEYMHVIAGSPYYISPEVLGVESWGNFLSNGDWETPLLSWKRVGICHPVAQPSAVQELLEHFIQQDHVWTVRQTSSRKLWR
jgi:serine/threonine protein kinase